MNAIFEKKSYFQLSGTRIQGLRGYLPMFHPHGEIVYVEEGNLNITVEGIDYQLHPGDGAIIFPYLIHAYEAAPDAKVILLLFDPAATAFDNTLLGKKPVCCQVEGSRLCPLMDRAVTMAAMGKRKTAMAYLNAVLGECLEQLVLAERDSPSGDITLQLLSYCEEHFGEDITVERIAQALYISESYVTKLFNTKLNCAFRNYVNQLRIMEAKKLLRSTSRGIVDIMLSCGFNNQSSFNRVFSQETGMTPRQYRQSSR